MKSKLRKLTIVIIVICLVFAAITQIANMQIAKRIPRDGEMVRWC